MSCSRGVLAIWAGAGDGGGNGGGTVGPEDCLQTRVLPADHSPKIASCHNDRQGNGLVWRLIT